MKTAVLFPGQGAQYPGMGKDFYEKYPQAKALFNQTAAVLGQDFLEIIFNGPEDKLRQTENTQPAILAVSSAIYRVLITNGLKPAGLAGLSLGEYSALVAAGVISFAEALPLVRKRGIFMQEAVPAGAGGMTAIMGLSHETVTDICNAATGDTLVAPANYNCPGQIVVSGHLEAISRAVELAREAGAKRITSLKVSAPFHCALLDCVGTRLAEELDSLDFKKPEIPVVFNVSAAFTGQPEQVKENLVTQVSKPILWEQSVHELIKAGITRFIGLGPGTSLTRLMKRIAPDLEAYSVETVADLEKLAETGLLQKD